MGIVPAPVTRAARYYGVVKTALMRLLCVFVLLQPAPAFAQDISDYDVVWNTQSRNSSESMPCGGGDIGLNVWVENGEVLFYLSRSGTFDENNQMLKLGRIRLKLSPDPFAGRDFKQELLLKQGQVRISGGWASVTLWVDVFRPVVHAQVESRLPVSVSASYESWRYADRVPTGDELWATSYRKPQAFPIKTYRDEISLDADVVSFHHRNRDGVENVFDRTVAFEGMNAVKAQMFNPVKDRTFGGAMRADGMIRDGSGQGSYSNVPFRSYTLRSKTPTTNQEIEIALHVAQTATLDDWRAGLQKIWKEAERHRASARTDSARWWAQFWDRSYIFLSGADPKLWQAGRNYQLFRYMLAANAYGEFPTKFNGGLFTFDPVYVDRKSAYTPDFRRWGGGVMTAQNQRLVYYPMFRSGDFDMLKPQFDFYLRAQRNAELRSQVYWKHGGASFTEQVEDFGLPEIFEWGLDRPANYVKGMQYNPYLEYLWDTVLEFCSMMLDTYTYDGRDVSEYVPFVESCLQFFDEHYLYLAAQRGMKPLDEEGHYVLYPGSAAETFKMTYNSASTIAALRSVTAKLLDLPARFLPEGERALWQEMARKIPPIPFRQVEGHRTIAPALVWQRVQNSEAPQLYPVFPWGLFGIGKPDLDVALNTYLYDPYVVKFRSYVGWKQYNIFAARLGLTQDAAAYTLKKLANGPHRFPAFWGPGFDWTPDHNWGGTAALGLQEMLMQTDGEKIYLLPAWPKTWNAKFKLHAPRQTVVEGTVEAGELRNLHVTPQSRAKDVVGWVQ